MFSAAFGGCQPLMAAELQPFPLFPQLLSVRLDPHQTSNLLAHRPWAPVSVGIGVYQRGEILEERSLLRILYTFPILPIQF